MHTQFNHYPQQLVLNKQQSGGSTGRRGENLPLTLHHQQHKNMLIEYLIASQRDKYTIKDLNAVTSGAN